MPGPLILVEELAAYLEMEGLVTRDIDHVDELLPSIWENPRAGAPQPRDGELGTVTLLEVTTAAGHDLDAWVEITFVDVVARFREERDAKLFQRAVRDLLAPRADLYGRKQWQMAGLAVQQSKVHTGDQRAGQDDTSYTRSQVFQIDCTRSALAGS